MRQDRAREKFLKVPERSRKEADVNEAEIYDWWKEISSRSFQKKGGTRQPIYTKPPQQKVSSEFSQEKFSPSSARNQKPQRNSKLTHKGRARGGKLSLTSTFA